MDIQLFRIGPYKAGDQVLDVDGSVWQAKRDMLKASSINTTYWTKVSVASPASPYTIVTGLSETGDNYKVIQAAIDAKVKGGKIFLPEGTFFCSHELQWSNKAIIIIGCGVGVTTLCFSGTMGFDATRTHSMPKSVIRDMSIVNLGERIEGKHGINITTITDIHDVYIKNFGGHGVNYYGNLGSGWDVSGSACYGVEVAECGGDGFHIQGGDANALNFFACNTRDNVGAGFQDNGFLGSSFWGCMGHANGKGNFGVSDNNNARPVIAGPYSEGGSPLSQISQYTTVLGGTWGSGFKINLNGYERHGNYLPLEGNQ